MNLHSLTMATLGAITSVLVSACSGSELTRSEAETLLRQRYNTEIKQPLNNREYPYLVNSTHFQIRDYANPVVSKHRYCFDGKQWTRNCPNTNLTTEGGRLHSVELQIEQLFEMSDADYQNTARELPGGSAPNDKWRDVYLERSAIESYREMWKTGILRGWTWSTNTQNDYPYMTSLIPVGLVKEEIRQSCQHNFKDGDICIVTAAFQKIKVTGITENGAAMRVECQMDTVPSPIGARYLDVQPSVRNGYDLFVQYDDGWRIQ